MGLSAKPERRGRELPSFPFLFILIPYAGAEDVDPDEAEQGINGMSEQRARS
jgi:hypothetical protein